MFKPPISERSNIEPSPTPGDTTTIYNFRGWCCYAALVFAACPVSPARAAAPELSPVAGADVSHLPLQIAKQLTTVRHEWQPVAIFRHIESARRSPLAPAAALSPSEPFPWLFSRRADFWFACGGASLGLLAATIVILLHGDRELDALDFMLSEFHLGATYDAIIRRRLWRQRRFDIVLIPVVILALTYVLSMTGHTVLLTSIAMYAAVWHRGRQSLGVARFYQRGMGGPASPVHDVLFRTAIYLPMLAAMLAYTHLAPTEYDDAPYVALSLGAEMTSAVGLAAVFSVLAYLVWTLFRSRKVPTPGRTEMRIHPGERWIVLAHAVAFGSAYVLGASNASFILVLAVHHEVQYLYFTWAVARRSAPFDVSKTSRGLAESAFVSKRFPDATPSAAVKFAAAFFIWPVIGFAGAVVGSWLQLAWLAPLGMGGLFCHYWLDGRIWTRRRA
jgi:hypothetical protein